MFLWHKECSSDNPPDEVLLKSFFFGWELERDESNCSFSSKKFSPKFFLDSKNAVLTTRLVKLSQTPSFFSQSLEKRSKIWWVLRKNCFSSNAPQDTVNAIWTLLPLSLLLRWKFSSARSPKRWTNLYVFQQNCFSSKHSLGKRNTVLTTFATNSRKFVFFSAQSPEKWKKSSTFFSKSNFPQGVLWTQKLQFWLFCWNCFAKNRNSFWLKVKNKS